ncbi:MAG: hypothetical protein VX454_11130 [Pseudomonadota bacterium]|nr:hypothetical protein [Pseudomonadota bacterium]
MALLKHPRWAFLAPKPVANKGTVKAFAACDALYRRSGVNQHLKNAVKLAIMSEHARQK